MRKFFCLICLLPLVLASCGKDARTKAKEAQQEQKRQRLENQKKIFAQQQSQQAQQSKPQPANQQQTFPSVEALPGSNQGGQFAPAGE